MPEYTPQGWPIRIREVYRKQVRIDRESNKSVSLDGNQLLGFGVLSIIRQLPSKGSYLKKKRPAGISPAAARFS
jgi:hypothetical protein